MGAALGAVTERRDQRSGRPATLAVSIADIADYRAADGTYHPACGDPAAGTGWDLTWTGATATKFIPLASGPRQLCTDPTTHTSTISTPTGPLHGQLAR